MHNLIFHQISPLPELWGNGGMVGSLSSPSPDDFLTTLLAVGPPCMCHIVCMLSHVQLFVIPQTVAQQAALSMEFSRRVCWSGLPFPSPRALPDPGIEPRPPALQADSLPPELRGKPRGRKAERRCFRNLSLCISSLTQLICLRITR